uniref:mRNA export factor GLE1 n=1 Tax=Culicoides sonorensis TaxID=179676 RepID=A0A336M362_CULSO
MDSNKSNPLFDQDLEDLIPFTSLKISAFVSAAKISKDVKNVTIGPNATHTIDENLNISELSQSDTTDKENEIKNQNNSSAKKTSPRQKNWMSETPEIDYYDSEPPSPKPISVDDIKYVSQKLQQKKTEKETAAQVRKELSERAKRISEADKLRQEKYLAATRAAEKNLAERLKESERILLEAVANVERQEREFELEQKQKMEEMKKRENDLKEKSKVISKFRVVHTLFKQGIERFMKAFMDMDKEMQASFVNYKSAALPVIRAFENVVQTIAKGNLDIEAVNNAEKLQKNMDRLTNEMISRVNEIKVAAQNAEKEAENANRKKQQELAEQKAKESEAAAALSAMSSNQVTSVRDTVDNNQPPPPQPSQSTQQQNVRNAMNQFVSQSSLTRYDRIMSLYKEHSDAVKKLSEDQNMKKYRMTCQIAVNTPINAISALNPEHLLDKYRKLEALLKGDTVTAGSAQVSVNQHPLGKVYVTLLLSRKFVNQSDTIMSNNAKAEFPIAAILIALWQKFPEVGQFFLAYLYKECPFFVPYFLPKVQGQSDEDYMKSIGYRYTNGVMEKHDLYLKRMSGIARLYAAIWITGSRRGETAPHPHNLQNGWEWLCEILNLDPLPEICATLIFEVLQVAGHAFLATYGKQFMKLLNAIQNQYFPKLNAVDQGGPKARLEDFVVKALRERKIDPPEGLLPPNFW